ncbi:MAG: ABC transporter permease [Pseudomonadota bacterium]
MKRTPWQIQQAVVSALMLRELKTRFGAHRLGAVWLFLEPAAHIVLLMLVFGFIRDRSLAGIEFSVFILTGLVPFFMFKSIALRIMDGLDSNRGLFAYRHVKPMDTFIARVLLEVLLYSTVFALLSLALLWLGVNVTLVEPLEFLLIMLLLAALGLGLGLILSVVGHALLEAKSIVRLAFMPLYFLSGIFFPLTIIPQPYRDWLLWNPLLHAIELIRGAFFVNYPVAHGISTMYVLAVAVVLGFIGLWLYRYRRLDMVAQ